MGWAAKRAVADTLIREKAVSIARARSVITDLRDAGAQCDTTIRKLVVENTALRGDNIQCEAEALKREAKIRRLTAWAWVGRGAVLAGVIFGGMAVVRELAP